MDPSQNYPPQNYTPATPQIMIPGQGDDITKFRLESQDVIGRIEHRLKGEYLTEEEEEIDTEDGKKTIFVSKYVSDPNARIMNDTGAKCVVFAIETIVNKIGALSNIRDDKIIDLCRFHMIALTKEIFYNWDKFNVVHKPDSIIDEIMSLIELSLWRAQGAGERESLTKIEQVSRVISESNQKASRWPMGGRKNE